MRLAAALGMILAMLGWLSCAEACAQATDHARAPEAADALVRHALELQAESHPREAIPLYRRALDLGPDDPALHVELGWAYAASGDDDSARGELAEARRLGTACQGAIDLDDYLDGRRGDPVVEYTLELIGGVTLWLAGGPTAIIGLIELYVRQPELGTALIVTGLVAIVVGIVVFAVGISTHNGRRDWREQMRHPAHFVRLDGDGVSFVL